MARSLRLACRLAFRVAAPFAALAGVVAAAQQAPAIYDDVAATRRALVEARTEGDIARARAERLEADAARASAQADRTAREAASVAARIQQNQAGIAGLEARSRLIERERRQLRQTLAARQQPLVRLTAALQRLSRRPPGLALLRPGSIRDTVHMRALFETILPVVEKRTAALRSEIARGRALEQRAQVAARQLRASQQTLNAQRQSLVTLETRQRLDSRTVTGQADREAERALALAEQARDLGTLVTDLGTAGAVRQALARLPGPIMRPPRPEDSQVLAQAAGPEQVAALREYMLPVTGRVISGFGTVQEGQAKSRGIALATRPGAQVVAPAAGRVAFAGNFRGYGRIVIIEHDGGWTTLVTGLGELDTQVGEQLVAGSPLGITGPGSPVVTLELRRAGEPVNPLEFIAPT